MQYLLDFTVDVAHGPKIWETFKYILFSTAKELASFKKKKKKPVEENKHFFTTRFILLVLLFYYYFIIFDGLSPLAIQYLQMRDSQELLEEDEVALCPKGTAQYTKMKNEYTRQIDAMGKMLTATGTSIFSLSLSLFSLLSVSSPSLFPFKMYLYNFSHSTTSNFNEKRS
jgi:hypothetical protein